LAIVVYATASGLRAECYQTHPESTSHAWTCRSTGQLLRPAGDGKHLYERGTASGLRRIDASTGEAQSLDASAEARQNAPLAVSADGKWIAAVANRHVVRLIDTAAGRHYADFPVPRSTTIEFLTWHPSGEWLAGLTDDGYVLVWSLGPWRAWLASHGLND